MENVSICVQALVDFIEREGQLFERSFMHSLRNRKYCTEFTNQIKDYQNEDGGWTRLDADYKGTVSSITCTIMALSKFNCLNLHNELYENTLKYLKNCQHEDGYWDESEEILKFNPPRWFYPNNINNRIWFTNGLTRYLISLGCTDSALLNKAKNYVKHFCTSDGIRGYIHNSWMGIVTYQNDEDSISKAIKERCMNRLYENCDGFECYNLLWALESLISLNLGLENKVVRKLWDLLNSCKQDEDGGFSTEAGTQHRVDLANRLLYTLLKLGIITPSEIKF